MNNLIPLAEQIAVRLKARGETISVAESSSGGLISVALLAIPGASVYFIGSGVLYSRQGILALRDTRMEMFSGMRGGTEPWALMLARTIKERCATGGWGKAVPQARPATGMAIPSGAPASRCWARSSAS
jgi:nicotinamide mononucleotide (NMN) deamidase PncC